VVAAARLTSSLNAISSLLSRTTTRSISGGLSSKTTSVAPAAGQVKM